MTDRERSAGFTVVEILVAAVIVAVMLLSLSALFGLGLKNNAVAKEDTVMGALAWDKLEELKSLPRQDLGLQLLQEIRDESHRFAVTRHRKRRKAKTLRSRIDRLQGVGAKRRSLLLRRFGSATGVEKASAEELQETLGPSLGLRVYTQLHPDPPPATEGEA